MLREFINLLYPRLCLACGEALTKNETHVCLACFDKIAFCPYTASQQHPVEKIFWGRCRIEAAQSLLIFNKHSIAQSMLHRLKYQGEKQVGEFLGKLLGKKLLLHSQISASQLIIPIPLHISKVKQRGYNQSEVIATGISNEMNIPVAARLLSRPGKTESQTRKSRSERVDNVGNAFHIDTGNLPGVKNVLLVDDVVTTGATLEACIKLLEPHFSVSVATVAYQ